MALNIKWTKRASKSFHKTVIGIEEEWNEQAAKRFVNKVNNFLQILRTQPKIGKIELREKSIRGFVISRQTTVLYRIKEDAIVLLKFFNNRQNPRYKLK